MKKLNEVPMQDVKIKPLKVKCEATLAEADLSSTIVDNVRYVIYRQ